jgi:predicted enzyme related to lactoylglutathione lyase
MPSPHFTSIMPSVPVESLPRAVAFYAEQLGFEVEFQNGTTYAIVSRDGIQIGLAAPPLSTVPAGHGRCYFKLSAGIDELYEDYRARGVTILHELRDESYAMREFLIADADQNQINFGQPLE